MITLLKARQPQLAEFGVQSLALFGSVARDEAKPDSDVDLLVEFSRPIDLFALVRLQTYLEDVLHCAVDLGTLDSLKPQLRPLVEQDIILIMTPRDWKLRVQDILQAIAEIQTFTAGMTFEEFQADTKTIRAVIADITILGEAANSIPADVQAQYPEVPWTEIRGIRNIVVHEYFQVQLDVLWRTIQDSLPPLVPQLQAMLEQAE